jgi:hypothetical protein
VYELRLLKSNSDVVPDPLHGNLYRLAVARLGLAVRASARASPARTVARSLARMSSVSSCRRRFRRSGGNGLGRLAVLDGTCLVGYLARKDIRHVLVLQKLGGEPAAGRPKWPRWAA